MKTWQYSLSCKLTEASCRRYFREVIFCYMDQCTAHLAQWRRRLFTQKSHAISTIPLPFCLLHWQNTRCQSTKQSVTGQEQKPKVQTKKSPQINIETYEMLRFAHKEQFWVTKATGHFVPPNKKKLTWPLWVRTIEVIVL